ncbi:MAG: cell division FtsA domain-containing protein [Clostridia bacterium]|nr:cell division FtsA domain-containing protein [Clostridia bacterium]
MKNKCVAVLDIRSNEITFLLGSRGVNGTFVFNGIQSERYEGYCLDGFFDEGSFQRAAMRVISAVQQTYQGVIEEIHVGVPSSFVSVKTKGHTASFHRKRKVSSQDVEALYESGKNDLLESGECIRKSAMYFALGDNRKYFSANDLYSVPTNMLKGALCYYFVSDYFYELITTLLQNMGFQKIKFIPSTLAQAYYLLPEKKREGYAFLLDVGFMTSSISVVYGNGIVHEESFDCGVASILVQLIQHLGIDYPVAEELLANANISGGIVPKDMAYISEIDEKSFPVQKVNDIIKYALDELCEWVDLFLRTYYKDKASMMMSVNPISITGEGISAIKGGAEHIAKRIGWLTEIVYPDLPYYDKPMCSSRIALLSTALSDQTENWLEKIMNILGGIKK